MTNVAWSLRRAVGLSGDLKVLPLLLLSLCLSKLFRAGLYEWALLGGFLTWLRVIQLSAVGGRQCPYHKRAGVSLERSDYRELPGFARLGWARLPSPH